MRLIPRLSFLKKPVGKSLALHAVLILLAIFGLPHFGRPPQTPAAVQVTLLSPSELPETPAAAPPPARSPTCVKLTAFSSRSPADANALFISCPLSMTRSRRAVLPFVR
ncbi:hypothetical protein [Mangrovicoccus ximenensis]|uniref:hypothetical protein n=1 Tax=Mangrovicoccus ximenensis TaxID=1911570 RepID=UPI000D36658C|nr:hypothetical protein [Mangrovicoccus ximenensis]